MYIHKQADNLHGLLLLLRLTFPRICSAGRSHYGNSKAGNRATSCFSHVSIVTRNENKAEQPIIQHPSGKQARNLMIVISSYSSVLLTFDICGYSDKFIEVYCNIFRRDTLVPISSFSPITSHPQS